MGAVQIARRNLGDSVAGPPLSDFGANLRFAKEFFTKDAGSYSEFKQQCLSLRIFAFAGVCAYCVLNLMNDPPKSSYWVRYTPMGYIRSIGGAFTGGSPPVFLNAKAESETNVSEIVKELVTTRR